MTYFLDFDRTLFDYEAFRAYFIALPEMDQFRDRILSLTGIATPEAKEEREKLWQAVDHWYENGGYTFAPNELAQFLYPDTRDFLIHHGASSVIVTSGGKEFKYQKDKVVSSGAGALVAEARYIPGRALSKAPEIVSLCAVYQAPFVFVDDMSEQLDYVKEMIPEISLFEMRRDGKAGSGKYPVIHTLSELR